MAKIFICYRREDSKWPVQWIYNDLTNHFGSKSVVFDVDTIPLGTDFREFLNNQVSKYVIPPELVTLAYKQATEVYAGPDLKTHLNRLISGLDRLIAEKDAEKERRRKAEENRKRRETEEAKRKTEEERKLKKTEEEAERTGIAEAEPKAERKRKQKEEQKRRATPKTYTNVIGMEFKLIQAGSFMMGSHISPEEVVRKYGGEAEWFKTEHPQHKVTISEPFYLQATAVTQGQWEKVTGKNPSEFNECGDDCPVEQVSWDDAQDFIKKLNKMDSTDNQYRLPTEVEWEYACRAGTTTENSYGDDTRNLNGYAWYWDNSGKKTHPVGQKKPNAWGLYDMHGNVWEWVEDDWHVNYDGAPDDGRAWLMTQEALTA